MIVKFNVKYGNGTKTVREGVRHYSNKKLVLEVDSTLQKKIWSDQGIHMVFYYEEQ